MPTGADASGFFDSMNPKDGIDFTFLTARTNELLPKRMQCNQGHVVEKEIFKFNNGVEIPYWPCEHCQILLRWKEVKLIPGEEGIP